MCDDHSSNDKSPGGGSTRASSQNSRMDSEIKRTMKSAQTGVVRQLKQETRATQLLFVSDLTPFFPRSFICKLLKCQNLLSRLNEFLIAQLAGVELDIWTISRSGKHLNI